MKICSSESVLTPFYTSPTITRRGVMWLGYPCDVSCVFCYNHSLETMKWMPLEGEGGSKKLAERFRSIYGNCFVDFMGGEPTLYPYILDLITYCSNIGLLPTVITNGRRFADINEIEKFFAAGLHDILLSVHSTESTYDKIIPAPKSGGYQMVQKCMKNLFEMGQPFRVNVTLLDWNRRDLSLIAKNVISYGARVINFISFNPYFGWSESKEISFQSRFSEILPFLREAIALCEESGVEANIRYVPFCCAPGLEEHIYTNFQLPYDPHEWDFNSWMNLEAKMTDGDFYLSAAKLMADRNGYVKTKACNQCSLNKICDGFPKQYVDRYGEEEAIPKSGNTIENPTFFITKQPKWLYI